MKAPPPPPRSARQPQRKMFLAFRICTRLIFSENGKDIFLFRVLPEKIFGQCGGASIRTRQSGKHIFWGKGFPLCLGSFQNGWDFGIRHAGGCGRNVWRICGFGKRKGSKYLSRASWNIFKHSPFTMVPINVMLL